MPVPRNALGSLLRKRRTRRGFSRARVAEAVGISPGTLEGWETGRIAKPPLTDILRVARYLSISLEELEQAALNDHEPRDVHERKDPGAAATRKLPGTAPLLEEAIRVMGWTEQQAADFLQTTPDQIHAWRRRSTPLPVVGVLALTSVLAARLRDGDA